MGSHRQDTEAISQQAGPAAQTGFYLKSHAQVDSFRSCLRAWLYGCLCSTWLSPTPQLSPKVAGSLYSPEHFHTFFMFLKPVLVILQTLGVGLEMTIKKLLT